MRAYKEARTHRRWREQVARLIALADPGIGAGPVRLGVLGFNVHAVRSYAERLIAEGERLERERLVFADWTRERGKGPEDLTRMSNAEVAHGLNTGRWSNRGLTLRDVQREAAGGWPGPLAREWGTVRCEACEGKGRVECSACVGHPGGSGRGVLRASPCHSCNGYLVRRCGSCRGRGYVKHPKREAAAANGGAWMIRAGRRLLDALDGRCPWAPSAAAQPSECRSCNGGGWNSNTDAIDMACPECRGTGHNLAGTLPPVEDSEATIVAVADAIRTMAGWAPAEATAEAAMAGALGGLDRWQREVYERNRERVEARLARRTRAVTRGRQQASVWEAVNRQTRRSWNAEQVAAHVVWWQVMREVPAPLRGELRHSVQRRERERRRQENRPIGTVREVRADGSAVVDLDL